MAGFKLSRAARRDMVEIGRYTLQRWGEVQTVRYVTQLDRRFRHLAREPRSGQPCDEIRAGYWRYREGRHVIFYRLAGKRVEIIRILHERMLPRRHL